MFSQRGVVITEVNENDKYYISSLNEDENFPRYVSNVTCLLVRKQRRRIPLELQFGNHRGNSCVFPIRNSAYP